MGVLVKVGAVKALTDVLDGAGLSYSIFDGCAPNPTAEQVNAGVQMLKESGCDFVISFGGGSPHDCAKAVSMLSTNGGSIRDYEGVDKSTKPMLPMVAVNTTAGTAAEMTRFCIITDDQRHVKMALVDWRLTPTLAVNDPNIKELGAKPEDFEALAENAMKDACGLTNPHQPTKQEVIELFRQAYEQQ